VDYAKNGNPVNIYNGDLPRKLIKFNPDWHKAEVTGAREVDYYESDKALGHLYRNIKLEDSIDAIETESPEGTPPLEDAITRAVAPIIRRILNAVAATAAEQPDADNGHAEQMHDHYVREMRFICITHSLVDAPDVQLKEEEVVLGTILANCAQSRWRTDRSYRMKLHAEDLVGDIESQIIQFEGEEPSEEELRAALTRAWATWCWAQHNRDKNYIESFALLVLGVMFDCLKRLGALPEPESPSWDEK
jgi:RNA-dependent RNA polymerase